MLTGGPHSRLIGRPSSKQPNHRPRVLIYTVVTIHSILNVVLNLDLVLLLLGLNTLLSLNGSAAGTGLQNWSLFLDRLFGPLLPALGSHDARGLRLSGGVAPRVVRVLGLPLAAAPLSLRLGRL